MLRAYFRGSIETHNLVQDFFFGEDLMLRRHDYSVNIAGGFAAAQLSSETAGGAEIPFEVIDAQGRPGSVPLYCYQPLTTDFIGERLALLSGLPTYAPAVRASRDSTRSGQRSAAP